MSDFYTKKRTLAIKEHKCFHCKQNINKGETYLKIAGVYEGYFFSQKSHVHCTELLNRFLRMDGENEYDDGTLKEYLHNFVCYGCEKEEECNLDCIWDCAKKYHEKVFKN